MFFVGTGEKPQDLEPFYPDRMASRIMGMGDVLTLIDKAQETMDAEKAAEAAEKMLKAQFTLEDFLVQMREMKKLGPLQDLLAMLPGVPGGKNALKDLQVDEGQMGRAEAIICSMTGEERRNPAIIGGSRRLRIARGSGATTADVNSLLKEFEAGQEDDEDDDGRQADAPDPGDADDARGSVGRRTQMSMRIRLKRLGAKKRPFYRVVVADQRSPRDGRFIENIGKYHPLEDPSLIEIDEERALHWLRRRRPAEQHRPGPHDEGRHLGEVPGREGEGEEGREGRVVKDLLEYLAREIVDEPDAVEVDREPRRPRHPALAPRRARRHGQGHRSGRAHRPRPPSRDPRGRHAHRRARLRGDRRLTMEPEPTVVVGRITRAHGVQGEVSVLVLSEVPGRFDDGAVVCLEDGRALTVESSRPHKDRLLVRFREVPDRAAAEALRGALVVVPASMSPPLPEGSWWDHQLLGCAVRTERGRALGTLTEIIHTAANDVWAAVDEAGARPSCPR